MGRITIVALVAILAACGSANTGRTDDFDGTWSRTAPVSTTDTMFFTLDAPQSPRSTPVANLAASRRATSPETQFARR